MKPEIAELFIRGGGDVSRDATISGCGYWRYELRRWWDTSLPVALFWMLNPSTADAATDDPTIRRCIYFARRFGCGGLTVVNWFAWRATSPKELQRVTDPAGPANTLQIIQSIRNSTGPIIAAWGGNKMARACLPRIPYLLKNRKLMCLGTNDDGSPKHPLYLPNDTPLVEFDYGAAA